MRKTTLLFLAVLSALNARAGISAGSNDDDRPTPAPVENLYFTTDEFIYVPIFTTSMGFRMMTGAKTSFAGQSIIKSSLLNNGSATGVYVIRTYQDGTVGLDSRSNSDGSPFESADGNTTQFSYKYGTQESVPGYLTFHSYTANVQDNTPRIKDPGSMSGTEVTLSRDLPKWLGKKLILKLTGGIGLNGIKSQVVTNVPSYIDTTTDYYSLNGAVPPGTSYTGGASELVTFTNPDGTSTSVSRNNFTLISAQPTNRVVTTATNTTAVTNVYKLKGAYFTTRIGPTFIYPFTENLRASVSLGLMAIYAATDFSVDESYLPEVGDPIETSNTKNERKILPGFYVDANVEYWVSDKTGFYAGAAYQGGGSYNQVLLTEESKYTTKVDLKSLSGLRAGMNIRF